MTALHRKSKSNVKHTALPKTASKTDLMAAITGSD